MLVQKIPFNIDFKRKTFYLYHDDDSAEQIVIDKDGSGELLLDMFKSLNMAPLKGFIEELNDILTEEQIQAVFLLWGNANQIMISDVVGRGGMDRLTAKKLLDLGMDRGVLTRGVNSTWKVIDKEIQKTMKDSAERMKRGPIKGMPSTEESMARIQLQKEKFGLSEGQGGMGHDSGESESESEGEEVTAEIIPEEPIKVLASIQFLQQKIKKLNAIINDPKIMHDEVNDKNAMITERNKLQGELRQAEMQQASKYTNAKGVKLTESGSVMNITKSVPIKRVISGGINTVQKKGLPQTLPQKKQVPTKGIPSPAKGVRKR
jgi:hypothetical protein